MERGRYPHSCLRSPSLLSLSSLPPSFPSFLLILRVSLLPCFRGSVLFVLRPSRLPFSLLSLFLKEGRRERERRERERERERERLPFGSQLKSATLWTALLTSSRFVLNEFRWHVCSFSLFVLFLLIIQLLMNT